MVKCRRHSKFFKVIFPRLILCIGFIYFYCEYLIYYVTQIQCDYPNLSAEANKSNVVYALVLADIHLLGSKKGHWLHKWQREWQMHRAFQTAITLHQPDVVFILGDIFAEGEYGSKEEFEDYLKRFQYYFKVPNGTEMYIVAGNHDIGFHHRITRSSLQRFVDGLSSPIVRTVNVKGNLFVLLNSMALEGDGCDLCKAAEQEIKSINNMLKCSAGSPLCQENKRKFKINHDKALPAPILMQVIVRHIVTALDTKHFPLYRESDAACTESDAAPLPLRHHPFQQRRDCLSRESTDFLVDSLRPRAVFGGHIHYSCLIRHSLAMTPDNKIEFNEYTVPSFSWSYLPEPKYYLLKLSRVEVKVSKCGLPTERSMIVTALLMALSVIVYLKYGNHRACMLTTWIGKKD